MPVCHDVVSRRLSLLALCRPASRLPTPVLVSKAGNAAACGAHIRSPLPCGLNSNSLARPLRYLLHEQSLAHRRNSSIFLTCLVAAKPQAKMQSDRPHCGRDRQVLGPLSWIAWIKSSGMPQGQSRPVQIIHAVTETAAHRAPSDADAVKSFP